MIVILWKGFETVVEVALLVSTSCQQKQIVFHWDLSNRIAFSLLALTIRKSLSYCLQLGNLVEDSPSNL